VLREHEKEIAKLAEPETGGEEEAE